MTLHAAMKKVLLQAGRPLKAVELSEEIKTLDLYRKRDGSPVQPDQVRARARTYPHLFTQAAGAIGLVSWGDGHQVRSASPRLQGEQALGPIAPPELLPHGVLQTCRSSSQPTRIQTRGDDRPHSPEPSWPLCDPGTRHDRTPRAV